MAFKSLSAGDSHTCGVAVFGDAYCWGEGSNGQLGHGSTKDEPRPIPVVGRIKFKSVSVGSIHTCGVTTSEEVYCWGAGSSGRLGNDSEERQISPVLVETQQLVGGRLFFASVAIGAIHTCGVTTGNQAYCWGAGFYGGLGNGSSGRQKTPVPVSGGHAFIAVSAGTRHTCGITSDGEAYCWGEGEFGQLGTGREGADYIEDEPVPVSGNLVFESISAGDWTTCAVTTDRKAYCWGRNNSGQVGNGSETGDQTTPNLVLGGHSFESVSTSGSHTCGVTIQGENYCWGFGQSGGLGRGSNTANQATPVQVLGGRTFEQLTAGGSHTCGITADGAAYCWGSGTSGQLGNDRIRDANLPVPVSPSLTFTSVDAGARHTCAITTQGPAYCWGAGADGRLGNGSFSGNQAKPVLVLGGHSFALVSSGSNHTCGVTVGDFFRVDYCWGLGDNGQLGLNSKENQSIPAPVSGGGVTRLVSAGGSHTCAISLDITSGIFNLDAARCWGRGNLGQLGTGFQTSPAAPTPVSGGHSFRSLSAGGSHTCGITIQGPTYCWGLDFDGQLGDGSTGFSLSPRRVLNYNFMSVSAGGSTTCGIILPLNVLLPDLQFMGGQAFCWGDGSNGKLGDGIGFFSYQQTTPVAVSGERTFVSLSVGDSHTCGITDNGDTYCWGLGTSGQLGNGTRDSQFEPVPVSGGIRFQALSAGANHTCAITRLGIVYCWGSSANGQIGLGKFSDQLSPAPVASLR